MLVLFTGAIALTAQAECKADIAAAQARMRLVPSVLPRIHSVDDYPPQVEGARRVDVVAPVLWIGVKDIQLDGQPLSLAAFKTKIASSKRSRSILYVETAVETTVARALAVLEPIAEKMELRPLVSDRNLVRVVSENAPPVPDEVTRTVASVGLGDQASILAALLFDQAVGCPAFGAIQKELSHENPRQKLANLARLAAPALEKCGCDRLNVPQIDALYSALADAWDAGKGWIPFPLASHPGDAKTTLRIPGDGPAAAIFTELAKRPPQRWSEPVWIQ